MSLRHALLGLLSAQPMTGYELARRFDQSAIHVWHARHSQIYPELRRLESEGLVRAESLPRGTLATKRSYSLTAAGQAELEHWVADVEPPARIRDAGYLKSTYLELASHETARRQFRTHLEFHTDQLNQWQSHADKLESRDTALLRTRLANRPPEEHEAIVAYKVHVYRGLVDRARTEIEWARRGLELVDRLEGDATETGAARHV